MKQKCCGKMFSCKGLCRKPMGFTLIELLVVIAIIAITTKSSINVKSCLCISFALFC